MKSFLSYLTAAETVLAGACYALAGALLFCDVALREIFSTSIWGAQRAAVLSANGAALLGIAIAAGLNRHLRPTFLDNIAPKAVQPCLLRIGHAVSAATLFCGAYYGAVLVLENREMGFTTPPFDLEIWIPQVALPYALASAGIRYLCFAVNPDLQPTEDIPG